jgi:hypothetical protein
MGAPHSDITRLEKQSLSSKVAAPKELAPQATSPAPEKLGIEKNPLELVTSLSTTVTEEEEAPNEEDFVPSSKNTENDEATPNRQATTTVEGPDPSSWKKPPKDIEDVTSEKEDTCTKEDGIEHPKPTSDGDWPDEGDVRETLCRIYLPRPCRHRPRLDRQIFKAPKSRRGQSKLTREVSMTSAFFDLDRTVEMTPADEDHPGQPLTSFPYS